MKKYQKLLLASGVATALAGMSMPSHAIIEGSAGEALLVPFVLYSNPAATPGFDPTLPSINTLVMVSTPSAVGKDTVPNYFTAPNSTPTNASLSELPDPDLGDVETHPGQAKLHIYFFNASSKEEFNDAIPVSPDDMTLINWGSIVENQKKGLNGTKGYMVVTNHKGSGHWNEAAKFSMFGNAWMLWPTNIGLIDTKIPVLPMSDGDDVLNPTVNRVNNVIHNSNGSIENVSPLASGIRTNLSDGNGNKDYTLFDLTMSNRFAPTLHVIWVDENIDQSLTHYVFDDQENSCSQPLDIPNELNVVWTSLPDLWPNQDPSTIVGDLPWVDEELDLCYPTAWLAFQADGTLDVAKSDVFYPGFMRYQIDEYVDNGIGEPESSAVAFSIQLQVDILNDERDGIVNPWVLPTVLPVETALAGERGKFTK